MQTQSPRGQDPDQIFFFMIQNQSKYFQASSWSFPALPIVYGGTSAVTGTLINPCIRSVSSMSGHMSTASISLPCLMVGQTSKPPRSLCDLLSLCSSAFHGPVPAQPQENSTTVATIAWVSPTSGCSHEGAEVFLQSPSP